MPSRPYEAHFNKEIHHKHLRSTHPNARQHGHHAYGLPSGTRDVLLSIPTESLTHVTAYLDPPDLLALARSCKQLHTHVTDDNTWRRAYVHQYLGISPESDLHDEVGDKILLLRREESSWRKEFILRYRLRRRWEFSRNPTITHIPHHSAVAAMHLMPHTTLLAASLQYGVVSRSYPLSGKVLRGFLDATGTVNGLGIGNPNAEFSPHVSSIALASEGGTAKVLWGFRNGEVAVTTALRAMDHNRSSAARLIRCLLADCHEGAVESVAWVSGGEGTALFVSGGVDGRVKLWEAKGSLRCLWTSIKGASLVPDSCVKVAMDFRQGVITAGLRSGSIMVWTGFPGVSVDASDSAALEPCELRIPPLAVFPTFPSGTPPLEQTVQELTELHIVPEGEHLSLLAAYNRSPFFHRLSWNAATNAFDRTLFGEADAAPIRTILPVWATRQGEGDFVIAGDLLGNVSIYPWRAQPSPSASSGVATGAILGTRRFAAHEGAVTALAWNSAVLVTGSARGTVKVWDALTLVPLRTFASPSSRPVAGGDWDPVGQILLECDAVVVSVGNKVLAWKAGPVGKHAGPRKGKVRAAGGRNSHGVAKWQQHIEMYRDIAESKRELAEEQKHTQRSFGREKEQLSTLAHLGLSEVEAVEYVLMLSRDEEEARRESAAEQSRVGEEGVFIADFDDVPTPMATPSTMFGSEPSSVVSSGTSSSSAHSSPSPSSGSYANGTHVGRSFPRATSSSSNHKVQVSLRAHPEPMEAGFSTSSSPLPSRSVSTSSSVGVLPSTTSPEHFPAFAISRTPSSTSASGSSIKGSAPGSPQSVRSAWSMPMRSLHSSEVPSPSRVGAAASPLQSPARSLSSTVGSARRTQPVSHAEEDEDLQYAIELSLAEARSRGDEV